MMIAITITIPIISRDEIDETDAKAPRRKHKRKTLKKSNIGNI